MRSPAVTDPSDPLPTGDADDLGASMARYRQGDTEAFEALHAQLRGPLRGYLMSLTRDSARADDLVQETFLQLHRSRHTYTPSRPLKPWVFGIARNVYLIDQRARRSEARRRAAAAQEAPEARRVNPFKSVSTESWLQTALENVEPPRREALLLHYGWGYTFEEIGARLGISRGAAKLRSHRGVQTLRLLLDAETTHGNLLGEVA